MGSNHKKESKSFTMMIVPHSGKDIKKFKVPKAAIKVVCGALIVSFCYTGYITHKYSTQQESFHEKYDLLNNQFLSQLEKTNSLNIVSENQKKEIEDLKNTTDVVKERLEHLAELESQIREKYGLQAAAPIRVMDSDKVVVTRGLVKSVSTDNDDFDTFNIENYYGDEDYIQDDILLILNSLTDEIDSQTSSLEGLMSEVDSRVKYLDHRPSRYPVSGRITSRYGYRLNPITGVGYEFHQGIDLAANQGAPVYASGAGRVIYSAYQGSYGNLIIIDHGYGLKTAYAHNSANLAKVGQNVKKGDLIGRVGSTGRSTGPHVHFEIRQNNSPIDPIKFLNSN